MADATYALPGFLGGEISKFAQGRFDRPDYRVSLNVCLNAFPVEIGAWTRRPGTMHAGTTRHGAPGRVIKFDFEQSNAVTMEFTDGWLRFRAGPELLGGNDDTTVAAISTANPAVVQTSAATDWATGDTLIFPTPAPCPLLENREFIATKVDTTHFSLADGLTGDNIDGSTLGAINTGTKVRRVQETVTPYAGGVWARLRAVQAEKTSILLTSNIAPQALVVSTDPTVSEQAQFDLSAAIFNDGPYLDPFTNGVQVTPDKKNGLVNLTLSFPLFETARAYPKDAIVSSGGNCYISLSDGNAGNSPSSSPSFWQLTSPATAINDGRGFLGSDIGRLVRLLSEPALWDIGTTYAQNAIVSYNPSGKPGQATYWQAQADNTGFAPGSDLVNWSLVGTHAALWTWGRIISLSTIIDRSLAGSVAFGNMSEAGGVTAPFNGVFAQAGINSARLTLSGGFAPPQTFTIDGYVGKNLSVSSQKVASVTIYPTSNEGFFTGNYREQSSGYLIDFSPDITFKLRASQSPPASPSSGTFLGQINIGNRTSAVSIVSSDQTTVWNYIWVEMLVNVPMTTTATQYGMSIYIGQLSMFNPPGSTTGTGVNVEILGPALLYTQPIVTWRLGVFSDTTGWPTCGAWHEGRLWLGGAVPNRFDSSVSNGLDANVIDFAPTDQWGTVGASNGISYTLNSDSVNPILWMQPDLQGLILGTQGGEWLLQAPTTGPMAPNNIAGRRVTKIGCANVEPRRTENTTVFAQRYGRKLMEYFADVYSGKFSAPNIADKAQHIVAAGIAELGYQSATTPIIWGRDAAGALFGCTYKRDTLTTSQGPSYAAWHRHSLGSGRLVESLCIGPSVGGDLDSLTMVTNDPATSIRHVEILTDIPEESADLADAWYLDDAIEPSSFEISVTPTDDAPYGGVTLNGLWHLNGKTVGVFAGGLDCGDFSVADGSCFVPFGDGVAAGSGSGLFTADFVGTGIRFVVGFTFSSDGQLVRPIAMADTGARNGPALGKTRRQHRYGMLLDNTKGISLGTDFASLDPAKLTLADDETPIGALDTFSGVISDTIGCDYNYDGMMAWRVSRPYPCNVVAASGFVQTQDR